MVASDADGAPLKCTIHDASGSIDAATSDAASILRGVAGRIMAATRITTVFHDKPRPLLTAARPVKVLSSATAAAFSTTYSSPASVFRACASGAYRA